MSEIKQCPNLKTKITFPDFCKASHCLCYDGYQCSGIFGKWNHKLIDDKNLQEESKKYKLGQVGLTRHPEIYSTETMIEQVFNTVEEELGMWKIAEQIHEVAKDLTQEQFMFVIHYVDALRGLDTLEEIKWLEFLKFRAYMARIINKIDSDREAIKK